MSGEDRPDVRWMRVTLPRPPAGEGFLVVEALRRLGARSVTSHGDRVRALLAVPGGSPDPDPVVADLRAAVCSCTSVDPETLDWQWCDAGEIEALWRAELRPVRVSRRLVLTGPDPPGSSAIEASPDDIVVRLAPSAAFGTPGHPTTRACLGLLDELVGPGDRLVDVGTGSGILAVAGARLGAAQVRALELDPTSCAAARVNARLNGVGDRVRVEEVRVTPSLLRSPSHFGAGGRLPDGVIANLEPDSLLPLVPGLAGLVRRGGWILLSGVPSGESSPVIESLRRERLEPLSEAFPDGWWTAVWRRTQPSS